MTKRQTATQTSELPPSWPGIPATHLQPRRTRTEIVQALAESQAAAETLPALEAKAAQATKHQKALEEYDRPFNERKLAALERGQAAADKVHVAEAELARAMKAALEENTWRCAKALVGIAAARDEMLEACRQVVAVDFDRALQVNEEDGSEASLLRAKSIAASEAGPAKLASLIDSLDVGFSPLRALPADGPSREVASIIMAWLWPGERKLTPLDAGKTK